MLSSTLWTRGDPDPGKTRELLKEVPKYGIDLKGELVTPTGSAIISSLAQSFGPLPEMTVDTFGYEAGTQRFPSSGAIKNFAGCLR